ncbi:MAG TPA: ATP-binding protein [Candidatus Melainabacteria bacterium]|nr:ATP-binding protein [Candidatus Melainabacteria bacterium]
MVNFPFDARKLAKLLFPAKSTEVKRSFPVEKKTQAAALSEADGREYIHVAVELMDSLFEALQHRVENETEHERFSTLELTAPKHIKEPDSPPHINALVSKKNLPRSFYRFRARNDQLCLSVRASAQSIEMFIIPTKEMVFLSYAEFDTRLKYKLDLVHTKYGHSWMRNGERVRVEEILLLLDRCLSSLYPEEDKEGISDPALHKPLAVQKLPRAQKVDQHKLEVQNLAWKIVQQQEETKRRVARDLHDTVIADLLMLKRYMSGDRALTNEELLETLDEVVEKLRDICNDYAPRNLQDWGLKVSVEGLLERVEERSGITCNLDVETELPRLPELIQLHIFRIIQEALNNAEKYSSASEITVKIEEPSDGCYIFTVSDNGAGYDASILDEERTDSGGMGMSSMRQRAEIMRSLYSVQLTFASRPEEGAEVRLEVRTK